MSETLSRLETAHEFVGRHIGPSTDEKAQMLQELGFAGLDAFIAKVVPPSIRLKKALSLPAGWDEHAVLTELRAIAAKNHVFRSFIGMGYSDCITPPVIQRNVLENPGWYTQYTPYQAEIAQGRLEALLNFQTMVADLTGLPVANASLLDEGTAAAEAMASTQRTGFFVAEDCHPQTIEVVRTRAESLGFRCVVGKLAQLDLSSGQWFGVLAQYPATDGTIADLSPLCAKAKSAGAIAVVATDLLALTLLKPPGEFGADIAVGSSQRFGVPLGFGGPHAAFFATRDEFK